MGETSTPVGRVTTLRYLALTEFDTALVTSGSAFPGSGFFVFCFLGFFFPFSLFVLLLQGRLVCFFFLSENLK